MTAPDDDRIFALADRFIAAIQTGDIEAVKACYHSKAEVWLNTAGVAVNREANLAVLAAFAAKTSERRYEDRRVRILPDGPNRPGGYVQQHVLHATHKAGPVSSCPPFWSARFKTTASSGWRSISTQPRLSPGAPRPTRPPPDAPAPFPPQYSGVRG